MATATTTPRLWEEELELRAFLRERGVDLSGEQQTKTKTALDYFSKAL